MILGVLLDCSRRQVCLWTHGEPIICLIGLCEDEDALMDTVCLGQGLARGEHHMTVIVRDDTIKATRPGPVDSYKIGVVPSFYRCLHEEPGIQKSCRVSNSQTWN